MENLVEYLGDQMDNFSTSNDIIKNVKLSMSTENEMIMIRSMLREIANWDSSRKGWKLKDEFCNNNNNNQSEYYCEILIRFSFLWSVPTTHINVRVDIV